MGAGDEGRVAGQHDAAEHDLRRDQIVDRLKERRRARKNLGDLRRDDGLGVGFDVGDHVGPDQRRRNAGGMMAARGVGADIGERVAIHRPVPDDIVGAAADRGVVVAPRHRIADQLLALGQAERIELDHLAPQLWRHVGFVDRGAPGHIAGVSRLDLRQELRAHRGADAVGADQTDRRARACRRRRSR